MAWIGKQRLCPLDASAQLILVRRQPYRAFESAAEMNGAEARQASQLGKRDLLGDMLLYELAGSPHLPRRKAAACRLRHSRAPLLETQELEQQHLCQRLGVEPAGRSRVFDQPGQLRRGCPQRGVLKEEPRRQADLCKIDLLRQRLGAEIDVGRARTYPRNESQGAPAASRRWRSE
jgi:hypothetical protein